MRFMEFAIWKCDNSKSVNLVFLPFCYRAHNIIICDTQYLFNNIWIDSSIKEYVEVLVQMILYAALYCLNTLDSFALHNTGILLFSIQGSLIMHLLLIWHVCLLCLQLFMACLLVILFIELTNSFKSFYYLCFLSESVDHLLLNHSFIYCSE